MKFIRKLSAFHNVPLFFVALIQAEKSSNFFVHRSKLKSENEDFLTGEISCGYCTNAFGNFIVKVGNCKIRAEEEVFPSPHQLR